MSDYTRYAGRRQRLSERMGAGVAIIPTAPERLRNRDTHYPYRHDSYFYYLSAFTEPEAVVVIVGGAVPRSLLFCRPRDAEREIWDGYRYGPDRAREIFGFDEAYPIGRLDELMPQLLANQPAVYTRLGADAAWDSRVVGWLNAVRAQARTGVIAPASLNEIAVLVDEMRLYKDAGEIGTMQRAADISAAAHERAMLYAGPGRFEYEVEAELLHEFRRAGAQAPAYTSIVAGGANACVLHYVENNAALRDGDLLLIDAGCEVDGYASDITRTFPVNGRFTREQQAIYELVLAAQAAAIAEARPGNTWNAPHDAAVRVLAQGLLDLGLLQGSLGQVIETETYRKYYMHRTGHWLGLDVHDAGDYKKEGAWRTLEPGMVFTVEPGCYIAAGEDIPAGYANIGVRIEDDVVITATGCDILTAAAPKSVADIERIMRDRHG